MDELTRIGEQIGVIEDPAALLEGLFAFAPVGFQVYKADGHCLLVNKAFIDLFGSAPPPEYNVLCDEIAARNGILELIHRAFKGETIRLPPTWYDPRDLNQVIVKEGRRVAIEATIFPLLDRNRTVRHIALVFKDMTAELLAQLEHERVVARLQSQMDHMPIGCILNDKNFLCSYWNPAAQGIFGYAAEEVQGKALIDLLSPPDQRAVRWEDARRLAAGEKLPGKTLKCLTKKGQTIICEWQCTPLFSPDRGFDGTLCMVMDITERKSLEDQLRQSQKMEAIGRLAGGVAHDFNNILTVITGYCHTLLRMEPPSSWRSPLEEILKAGERAASLTRQLLAFSRRQVMEPKVVDLNAIVHDMDTLLRRLIGEDIELLAVLHPELGRVRADPNQIEQVIVNLAVNARDAMPEGGRLTLETANRHLDQEYVKTHPEVAEGEYVMLAISDTGVGMTPETLARMFEPFFTTKPKGQGGGLGLSTVYGIVRQSGGHVSVYSELGRGATFKIYLPLVRAVPDTPLPKAPPQETTGTETILLVEDDPSVRSYSRRVLEQNGYRILETSNGREAIEVCRRLNEPIHLMLTDVVMPYMNGPELAKKLAATYPKMKILYVSGYTENAIVHHGQLDAGTHFLSKPFTPDQLKRKVREVLDQTG
ncbi:MAG: PAS domain S-box protein [Planctomycetes bacterium]|nr:PAS domain S-box protein [Planctomycetota bacterium]